MEVVGKAELDVLVVSETMLVAVLAALDGLSVPELFREADNAYRKKCPGGLVVAAATTWTCRQRKDWLAIMKKRMPTSSMPL